MLDMILILLLLNIAGIYAIPGVNDEFGFKPISDHMMAYAGTLKQDPAESPVPTTKWIEQPLDHFDNKEKRTFKMKYLESLEFWKPNAPLFLLLNDVYAWTPFFKFFSICDLANATNGAMFMPEYRYYGDSIPLNTTVSKNLKYLSADQTMADIVNMIQTIKSSPDFRNSKVVVIGGGIGGNLAAWMRLKYPHVVDIAWASGAPVLAKKDFFEVFELKTELHYNTTDGCYDMGIEKFDRYEKSFQSDDGIKDLKLEENICENVDMRKLLNKLSFFHDKVSWFHCNYPDMTSITLPNNGKCVDYEFSRYAWSIYPPSIRMFYYQMCTEFGYFPTANSDKMPFKRTLRVDFYANMCSLFFGPEFDEKRIDEGIARTNKQYGGVTPNVTKVIFTNSNLDAFSKLSITKSLSKDAPARLIDGAWPYGDLWRENYNDSPDLTKARKEILKIVLGWLESK